MPIEFKLPQVSEGVETADVAEILVQVGDTISAGQIVLEVETEKAIAEINCPHSGRVAKIHVNVGDSIPVGAVLLTIEEMSTANSAPPATPNVAGPNAAVSTAPQTPPPGSAAAPASSKATEVGRSSTVVAAPVAVALKSAPPVVDDNGRQRSPAPAGPATRRLARQLAVELHQVTPSARGGRITIDDVKAYVHEQLSQRQPARGGVRIDVPPLPDFSEFGAVERQPLNKIAKASAANLSVAWHVIPHVTNHDLADVTVIEASRKQYLETDGTSGPKITMTAVVIKAVATVLQELPRFNSSLDVHAGELIVKKYCHIGCAVDTPHGLLVPVLRDADRKTIIDIAEELADLAQRARDRKLTLTEMQGASFTITNLGGIGGTAFTPIVNYPEVAILGLSRSRTELRLSNGQIEERLLMPLSLSYDHRVINGADAARFLLKLCDLLGNTFRMLVES